MKKIFELDYIDDTPWLIIRDLMTYSILIKKYACWHPKCYNKKICIQIVE